MQIVVPWQKSYLINLARRPDRLKDFRERQISNYWCIPEPVIFDAIDGEKESIEPDFIHGAGAYGNKLSHVEILETCVKDGFTCVCVFEDDLLWWSDCWIRLQHFLQEIKDIPWEMLLLGGQHEVKPRDIPGKMGVVKCYGTSRTHAYVVRGDAIKSLLTCFKESKVLIDWSMKKWERGKKVFAPSPFLFGQNGGYSDIAYRHNSSEFWFIR